MSNITQLVMPAQGGEYSVKVKKQLCCGETWSTFKTARLLVSVGQEYHEGAKLLAAINWCAKRFGHVEILVGDTLQRHSFSLNDGMDPAEAFEKSRIAGDDWLARNAALIASLPSVSITRWEAWRVNSAFRPRLLQIMAAYEDLAEFRDAVDEAAMGYCARKSRIDDLQDAGYRKKTLDLSYQYIFEELAIYSLIADGEPVIDIYPGSCLSVIKRLQGGIPEGLPPSLGARSLCSIKLERIKRPVVAGVVTQLFV